jgi:hypothetical protein
MGRRDQYGDPGAGDYENRKPMPPEFILALALGAMMVPTAVVIGWRFVGFRAAPRANKASVDVVTLAAAAEPVVTPDPRRQ